MNKKILIVLANYYKDISEGLLKSALKNIPKSSYVKIIRVPGVFEIPVTISKNIKKFDAFLALGCVIKGDTDHYDYICQAVTNGIMDISVQSSVPVLFGVLTCQNAELAFERSRDNDSNKGYEVGLAALELINSRK